MSSHGKSRKLMTLNVPQILQNPCLSMLNSRMINGTVEIMMLVVTSKEVEEVIGDEVSN